MRRSAAWSFAFLLFWAGTPASAQPESPGALAAPRPTQRTILVLDAEGVGIDPVVAPHVTDRLRAAAASMGYGLVADDARHDAVRAVRLPPRPSPADVWRATFVARAQRGVAARVWAESGRYVIELLVASLDGTGPFVGRDTASADELLESAETLLRRLLPPASEWDAETAARLAERAVAPAAQPAMPPSVPPLSRPWDGRGGPAGARRHPGRRWDLAIQLESAFGTSQGRFYNQLVGVRAGLRITADLILGAYAGYVNLEGRTGRTNNLLGYLQLEDRIRIATADGVSVPLRLGVGYLPYNGPFVRFAGGLNFPFASRYEIGVDLLAPTFWFLPEGRAVSFDVALELIVRLGDD